MVLNNFLRRTGIFLVIYHVVLLVTLPWYLSLQWPGPGIWITGIVLFFLTGFGVTAGYHRLYSHRSYDLNIFAEIVLLIFATLSVQGSILRWSCNHRLHHKYVDTDRDPYSIKRGFWYAHFNWLFYKRNHRFDPSIVPDLMRNKLLVFQDRYNIPLMVILNLASIFIVGFLCGDYWGAFVITFLLRMFFTHHSSFCVNSLAHTMGTRPFSQEHTAVNNWMVALLTLGEGYHNYHHTFPADYRNGVRWYQFDPTRILIWLLSKLRLARNLKSVDNCTIIKRRIAEEKVRLLAVLQAAEIRLQAGFGPRVHHLSETLTANLDDLRNLTRVRADSGRTDTHHRKRSLRRKLKVNLREWKQLYRFVLAMPPDPA